jgi:DNA-binding PadR family transcriptional regulator
MPGWIKIERDIQSHWIWQDEKYFRWWMTILLNVNYEAKKFPVNALLFICNPGESFRSIEEWRHLFSCSKPTVYKFFKLLENDGMITTKTVGKGNRRKHLLTVVNWQKYQQQETENFTENKPETLPKINPKLYRKCTTNKNDKNEKNDFDRFWDLYDKKTGKVKSQKLWAKLSKTEKETILNHIPLYKRATPEKQFRKNPETYLRNRAWEDEIIKPTNGAKKEFETKTITNDYKPGY